MNQIESLRRRLAESDEMRRVSQRKAEHNRRAWLITQMQLDLAEDRLCLLITGKPRPILESRVHVEVAEGEIVVPEDVEDDDVDQDDVDIVDVDQDVVDVKPDVAQIPDDGVAVSDVLETQDVAEIPESVKTPEAES